MRKRTIVCILLIGLLAFLAWWFWLRGVRKPVAEINPATTLASPALGNSQLGGSPQPTTPAPAVVPNPAKPDLKAQLREMMNDSNRPISFYGLVIDQDRNPIPGVKVTFQIRRTKAIGPVGIGDTFDYPSLTTGAEGRFSLTGATGAVLVVKSLEKLGYEPSEKATRGMYWYWREPKDAYRPSSDQPEVFRMWKKTGAEKLITADKFYGIDPDGKNYVIDVLHEKKTEGGNEGDFKVSLRRPAQIRTDEKYDWSCIIDGIGGGVIATTDEQMYRAPETGYLPRYEVSMSASDPQWSDRAKRQLYLKSREGKVYARLDVEIFASYRDKAVFSVKYYANSSGSRNLEYDPLQDTVKPPTPTPKP